MSASELERFETDLKSDTSLQEKVAENGRDMGAIVETAQASGYGFTLEEVKERIAERGGELSEDELDSVAGGRAASFTVWAADGHGNFTIVHW